MSSYLVKHKSTWFVGYFLILKKQSFWEETEAPSLSTMWESIWEKDGFRRLTAKFTGKGVSGQFKRHPRPYSNPETIPLVTGKGCIGWTIKHLSIEDSMLRKGVGSQRHQASLFWNKDSSELSPHWAVNNHCLCKQCVLSQPKSNLPVCTV